jgi:hypothetical protein
MNKKHLDEPTSLMAHPAIVALVVAVLGVLALLIVDHGPWTRPKVQTADVATYKTTGEAAHAVGAEVSPTQPKTPLETAPVAPEPEQPANPITR